MTRHYEKGQLVYVSPNSVRFDLEDIEYLLPYLTKMREGEYPLNYKETGYEGNQKSRSHKASFESVCQVAAEIDRRINECEKDRPGIANFIIVQFYCRGTEIEFIAQSCFLPEKEVNIILKCVISFISSGPCPRWINCIDCYNYNKCRKKKRVGITYRQWKRYKNREHGRRRSEHNNYHSQNKSS